MQINSADLDRYVLAATASWHCPGVAQTGQPVKELTLYQVTEEVVGLRHERTRFDFAREGGAVTGLTPKTPFMTLEAPRVEA